MKSLLLAGLITLSAALPAVAIDWVMVAENEVKQYYVDNDSVKTNGVNYLYTTKVVDFQRQTVNISEQGMDCQNALSLSFSTAEFTINGKLINRVRFENPVVVTVKEGTAPEIIYNNLCR